MADDKQLLDVENIATEAANKYGIPPKLLLALIKQESGGNPKAKSSAGAMGLTQLMPGTAKAMGVDDPWDPVQNVEGGARYLAEQLNRFQSVPLALAAYNAGPGRVKNGQIPNITETKNYVKNITKMLEGDKDIVFKPRTSSSTAVQPTSKKTKSSLASAFLDSALGSIHPARTAANIFESTTTPIAAEPQPLPATPNFFQQEETRPEATSLQFAMNGEDKVAVPQNKQEEDDFRAIGQFEYDRREALMKFLGQLQESEEKESGKKNLFSPYPSVFDERILALLDRSPINESVK